MFGSPVGSFGMVLVLLISSTQLFIKTTNMKKVFFMILGMTVGVAVMADTGTTTSRSMAREKTMSNLRVDVRARDAAAHQVNHDLGHFRFGRAIHDHKAVAQCNKQVNADSWRLRAEGVDHPVTKARRQIRVQNDNVKDRI